jgi:conjugal transfer pilus assembly protein TraV
MVITRKFMWIFMLVFLSGCTAMNSKFDCQNKPGINCKNLDQVNDMVDNGVFGRDIDRKKTSATFYSKNMLALNNPTYTLRSGEQVIRVWIAPYQDTNNNYHNESTLYTVIRKSNWAVPIEIKEL